MNFEKLLYIAFLLISLFLAGANSTEGSRKSSGPGEQNDKPDLPLQVPTSPRQHAHLEGKLTHTAGGSNPKDQFYPSPNTSRSELGQFADDLEKLLEEDSHDLDHGSTAQTIGGPQGSERETVDNKTGGFGFASHLPSGLAAGGKVQHHSIVSSTLTSEHGHRQQQKPAAGASATQSHHEDPQGQVIPIHVARGSRTNEQFVPNTSSSGLDQKKTYPQLMELEKFLLKEDLNDFNTHSSSGSTAQTIGGSHGSGRQTANKQPSGFDSHRPSGSAAGGIGQQHPIMSNALFSAFKHQEQQQKQQQWEPATGVVFGEKRKAAYVLETAWHKKPAMGEGSHGRPATAPHQNHPNQPLQNWQKNPQIQSTANAIEADKQLAFVRKRLAQKVSEHTTLKNDIEIIKTNISVLFTALEAAKAKIENQQMTEEQKQEEKMKEELEAVDPEIKEMQEKLEFVEAQVKSLKTQATAVRENLVNPHVIKKDDVKCDPGNSNCTDCRKYLCLAYKPICHWNGQKCEIARQDDNIKIED